MLAETQAFIASSVAQHQAALETDLQILLAQQKQDFERKIKDLEQQHHDEIEKLHKKIKKEEKRTKKARKWRKKLIKATAKLTNKEVNSDLKRGVILVWRNEAKKRKNRRLKDKYCRDFHRRGRLSAYVRTWKGMCRFSFKDRMEDQLKLIERQTEEETRRNCEEEKRLLQLMVSELSDDLRHETLLRSILLQEFQQSIARTLYTLSSESDTLSRDPVSKRNFSTAITLSPASRRLVYGEDS